MDAAGMDWVFAVGGLTALTGVCPLFGIGFVR